MVDNNANRVNDFDKVQELLVKLSDAEYTIYLQNFRIKYLELELQLHKKFAEIESKAYALVK